MSERLAEITVSKEVRAKIKKLKGKKTYTEYLSEIFTSPT